jgi:WD40 repeat protein/tRNA A-37 threonylcarbamoyl transferase component Bud32
MTSEAFDSSQREQHFQQVLAAYLQAVEAGQRPDRDEWLNQHPDLAAELRLFFANQDDFAHRAEPMSVTAKPVSLSEQSTLGATGNAPEIGEQVRYFGDYELLEKIASGGMGVVYKARQVSVNRIVALKMILAGHLASETDVRRFQAEAEAAANLDHPNLVPIYEVGEQRGQHYFSMKFVEGGSLPTQGGDGIGKGPWEKKSAQILATVARAVHYAHQRGILHRDLKPANILIDAQGQPQVTDFGLAKKVGDDSGMTQTGAIVGTPSYMAPEQAAAKKDLSVAVDVYSLGAILYELLTGQPPFRAATPLDTLLQVIEKEPPSPRSINPQVNRDLETIALKCLAKEPAQRYPSAEALAEELERWLRGEPILARPVRFPVRAWRWCKRNPWRAAAGAVLGLALMLALGQGVVIFAQARRDAYQSRLHQAEAERRAGNRQRSLELLREAKKARFDLAFDEPWELRQAAFETVASPGIELVRSVRYIEGTSQLSSVKGMLQVSEDGQTVRVRTQDKVKVYAIPSGEFMGEEEIPPDPPVPSSPVAEYGYRGRSENGQWYVLEYGGKPTHTVLWDVREKMLTGMFPLWVNPTHPVVQTDDGRRVAFVDPYGVNAIKLWDWHEARMATLSAGLGENLLPLTNAAGFSPDGTLLAVHGRWHGQDALLVYEVETGELIGTLRNHFSASAWSRDGRWLITAGNNVYPPGLASGRVLPDVNNTYLSFSEVFYPTPTYVAKPSDRVVFRADGKMLFAGGNLWHVDAGEQRITLRRSRMSGNQGVFHFAGADGMWLSPDVTSTNILGNPEAPMNMGNVPLELRQIAPGARTVALKHPGFTDPQLAEEGKRTVARPTLLAFHPDGKHAAVVYYIDHVPLDDAAKPGQMTMTTGNVEGQWTLEYWDLDRAERVAIWNTDDYAEGIHTLVFSPDGNWLATRSKSAVCLWSTADGSRKQRFDTGESLDYATRWLSSEGTKILWSSMSVVAFSSDSQNLSFDRGIKNWRGELTRVIEEHDTATGQKRKTWGSCSMLRRIALSPDGKIGATTSGDFEPSVSERILTLDDATGARRLSFATWRGHESSVQAMAFSPDGSALVTCDSTGIVKVWNLPWLRKELSAMGLGW